MNRYYILGLITLFVNIYTAEKINTGNIDEIFLEKEKRKKSEEDSALKKKKSERVFVQEKTSPIKLQKCTNSNEIKIDIPEDRKNREEFIDVFPKHKESIIIPEKREHKESIDLFNNLNNNSIISIIKSGKKSKKEIEDSLNQNIKNINNILTIPVQKRSKVAVNEIDQFAESALVFEKQRDLLLNIFQGLFNQGDLNKMNADQKNNINLFVKAGITVFLIYLTFFKK